MAKKRQGAAGAGETDPVQWVNDVFEALSDERRRLILHHVIRSERRVDLDDIVDFLLEASPDASQEEAESIAIRLHHCDLPKLHDLDIIRYDAHDGTVRFRGRPPVETFLEHVEDHDLP